MLLLFYVTILYCLFNDKYHVVFPKSRILLFYCEQYLTKFNSINICIYNDPEPDVPKDVTPMAQCAFESLVFNVSAVYTN